MTQDLIEDPAITAVTSRETEPGVTESCSTSGAALGASLVAAAAWRLAVEEVVAVALPSVTTQ